MRHSITVENYLKAMLHLQQGKEEVTTNQLADHLETKASSITDMLKKLAKEKLVKYTPYKGASLTKSGYKQAVNIVRKHRLWEVFLVDKLKFNWDEVHDIAEQLEHVHSKELTSRLDAFLDFPAVDPHGDPIPDAEGNIRNSESTFPLSELAAGSTGLLMGVGDSAVPFLQFLNNLGLSLGVEIELLERFEFDQSVKIGYSGRVESLSQEVAKNLLIKNS